MKKLDKLFNDGNHICVGLDTDIKKIPPYLLKYDNPVIEFNKIVIENTIEGAAAYKINFAFYEKDGSKGFDNISKTLELIPKEILTVADAKRGDIGNTSEMYAESIYNHFNFDAVTLHPYMGYDSIEPFLKFNSKLNFILALTSNKGSSDFEKQKLSDGSFLFQTVIKKVNEWNELGNCGIVFGATNSSELKENINLFGNLSVLLPGIGAQGGSLDDVVSIFSAASNNRFLINVSRALLYCDSTENFGMFINKELTRLNESIRKIKNK